MCLDSTRMHRDSVPMHPRRMEGRGREGQEGRARRGSRKGKGVAIPAGWRENDDVHGSTQPS